MMFIPILFYTETLGILPNRFLYRYQVIYMTSVNLGHLMSFAHTSCIWLYSFWWHSPVLQITVTLFRKPAFIQSQLVFKSSPNVFHQWGPYFNFQQEENSDIRFQKLHLHFNNLVRHFKKKKKINDTVDKNWNCYMKLNHLWNMQLI